MRYFVLLMALVLSSCSHDDSQVNNGWVIYDLRPLQGGRVMYYAEDEIISIGDYIQLYTINIPNRFYL